MVTYFERLVVQDLKLIHWLQVRNCYCGCIFRLVRVVTYLDHLKSLQVSISCNGCTFELVAVVTYLELVQ